MNETLIGVITCERDAKWLAACRETWLKDVPTTMDVVIADATFMPDGIPDSYENLPHKTKTLARYAWEKGYRNLIKCDVDTYVRPKLIVIPEAQYAGRWRGPSSPWPQPGVPERAKNAADYCSGGIYFLRKRAIQIIAEMDATQDIAEDRLVGNTLLGYGIRAHGLTGYCSSTLTLHPPTKYLENPKTIAVMNIEEPGQMIRVHKGIFDVRHASGSRAEDYPVGSLLRNQMR